MHWFNLFFGKTLIFLQEFILNCFKMRIVEKKNVFLTFWLLLQHKIKHLGMHSEYENIFFGKFLRNKSMFLLFLNCVAILLLKYTIQQFFLSRESKYTQRMCTFWPNTVGTWWTARIAIARKICSTRFYYCSTPFEQ